MRAPTVLLCGNVTLDRYGERLLAGGTVYYAGRAYRALGARVRVVTAHGDDFPAGALAGLEVEARRAGATTTFTNEYQGGVRAQRISAVAPPLVPNGLPDAWRDADVLHLGPVMQEIDIGAWVAAVRPRLVGIGIQGWVRAVGPEGKVIQPPWRPSAAELAAVHAATVGEEDLNGQGDLLERLITAVPIVAFTHGARGCDVFVRGRSAHVGVYPAAELDPTGAGDVFAAGFFLALASGAPPEEAARLGAAAASVVIEGRAGDTLDRVGEARLRVEKVPLS